MTDIDLLKADKEIRGKLKVLGYSEDDINNKSWVHSLPDHRAQLDVYIDQIKCLSVTPQGVIWIEQPE